MTVICGLLGVPVADEPLLRDWSAQLTRLIDGFGAAMTSADGMPDWLQASVEMHRYVGELVDARRGALVMISFPSCSQCSTRVTRSAMTS